MLIAWAEVWADSTRHVARGKWLVKKGTPPLWCSGWYQALVWTEYWCVCCPIIWSTCIQYRTRIYCSLLYWCIRTCSMDAALKFWDFSLTSTHVVSNRTCWGSVVSVPIYQNRDLSEFKPCVIITYSRWSVMAGSRRCAAIMFCWASCLLMLHSQPWPHGGWG